MKSIIVVDDERDVVELFRDALIASGYNVSSFTDPITALDQVQKNPEKYNLLVSDYSMKKLNGFDLAIRVKEVNDKIKVIIIVPMKISTVIYSTSNCFKSLSYSKSSLQKLTAI